MKNIKLNDPKIKHVLSLADSPLILGQRLGEWCGHGPVLEQDIALTNISLDLIGQARLFYQYAATLSSTYNSEDDFAYWRLSDQFLNVLLVEMDNGDFAQTIVRQLFYSVYSELLFNQLKNSDDKQIGGIALKSLKEVAYHKRYSSEWSIRLGDGTEESHNRMQNAVHNLWRYTDELWTAASYEAESGISPAVDNTLLKKQWNAQISDTFNKAGLEVPENNVPQLGGKEGRHSEGHSYIIGEMQSVARSYPGATW